MFSGLIWFGAYGQTDGRHQMGSVMTYQAVTRDLSSVWLGTTRPALAPASSSCPIYSQSWQSSVLVESHRDDLSDDRCQRPYYYISMSGWVPLAAL